MILTLKSGATVLLIGDPHLGKTFETGVPLERRGEREKRMMEHFKRLLNTPANYIVIMGDLFDHPYVSMQVISDTYKALANAAAKHRTRTFIVQAGNHDLPRNLEAFGAFDMLALLAHLRVDNLHIVVSPTQIGPIACFPWEWALRADEQRIIAPTEGQRVELICGHWDLKTFDEKDNHLCPVKLLRDRYGDVPIWSGHYHVPGEYVIDDMVVNCTGSMEPLSHGEDPNGDIYITVTPEELEGMESEQLRNKAIRVLLREGEEMPTGIDCLALTPKRLTDKQGDDPIELGNFSWGAIVAKKLADLPQPVREFIEERLSA